MARLSDTTIRQTLITLLLMSTGMCPVARAQTMTAEQRLQRSMKSGDQAGVWAALNELAHRSLPIGGAAPAVKPAEDLKSSRITTIDYPGAVATLLVAINNEGVIIGYYADSVGTTRSFLREPDGTFVLVDPPGAGIGPGFGAIIWSINDAGSVTGTFTDQGGVVHAYLRTRDGKYTQIDVEGAGPLCCTLGLNINEEDAIAGEYVDSANLYHEYLRSSDGTVERFSVAGAGGTGFQKGTLTATVDGLNRTGDIAGEYFDDLNVQHGLLRFRDGRIAFFDVDGAGTGSGHGTA